MVSVALAGLSQRILAQAPGTVELSGLAVWHTKTAPIDALRGFGTGARLGVWLPGRFALEGQLDLTRPENSSVLGNRFNMVHYSASLLFNMPLQKGGTVYLRGGYGKLHPDGACLIDGHRCYRFGAATGAIGFRVPMGRQLNLRGEGMVRTRPVYKYTSFGGSLGVSILAGHRAGPRVVVDDDQDGVGNGRDKCEKTPRGALVDSRGCPSDFDGDGVYDGIDRCPGTPSGSPVDPVGCPVKPPE